MAKTGRTGIFGLLAYVAICLNAIAWVLRIIAQWVGELSSVANICVSISSLFLLAVVIYVSYDFARRQTKGWRILWWVLVIVSLLAVFVGIGVNFLG